MKKTFILVAMIMVSALVLSACAGANNQNMTPVPGVTEPGLGTDIDATPVMEETLPGADVVETPVIETPVVDMTDSPDMMTPEAGVPVTGDDDCNPNRLHGLLDMDMLDANGEQIGDVDAVIVMRDSRGVSPQVDDAAMTGELDATPAAGEVVATPTVIVELDDMSGTMLTDAAAPRIAYVRIDLENNDDDLLVPFSAFDMTVFDRDVPATTDGTVEDAANEFDTCALTFNSSVTADSLTNAPVWSDDFDMTVENWDEQFHSYWGTQGLTFNDADFANLGYPVVLGDSFNNINARNFNDEDLGEVEDFIINRQSGELDYAILATGGFLGLGERYIPVPTNMLNWVVEDSADLSDTGYVVINIADDEWENAPVFDGLNEFDTNVEGWDTDIQSFWNNLTGTTTE